MSNWDPCRGCGQRPQLVVVIVPARLSHTGEEHAKAIPIDFCVADIVAALNGHATQAVTAGACCGHGEGPGGIVLEDGRVIQVRGRRKDGE